MTLPVNSGDRERNKFVETLNGDVALRILLSNDHDLKIDEHGNMPTVDRAHYMIHENKGYTISDYDSDTDTGGIKIWHIKTPDTTIEYE